MKQQLQYVLHPASSMKQCFDSRGVCACRLIDIFIISKKNQTFNVIDLFEYHALKELYYSDINLRVSSFQVKGTNFEQV